MKQEKRNFRPLWADCRIVVLLPFVLVYVFGGLGVMSGPEESVGAMRVATGWTLFYAFLAAAVIAIVIAALLRRTRRIC